MTRERVVVGVILVVVIAAVVARGVVTVTTGLIFVVAVPSIILHEVSHGIAALWFGDDTARRAGRLTLNPLAHIDMFGTLLLPALLALSGLGVFGYAKPVPVNPSRMRHPRNDAVWVSLAGPATNLALALLAALWLRQQHPAFLSFDAGSWQMRVPLALGFINVVLAAFNLLPIPPLDGSSVVGRFLPAGWMGRWSQIQRYGMVIVILLVLVKPDWLGRLLTPLETAWLHLVAR